MGLSAASKVRRRSEERARRRLHRKRVHAGHMNAMRGKDQDEDAAEFVASIIARAGIEPPETT